MRESIECACLSEHTYLRLDASIYMAAAGVPRPPPVPAKPPPAVPSPRTRAAADQAVAMRREVYASGWRGREPTIDVEGRLRPRHARPLDELWDRVDETDEASFKRGVMSLARQGPWQPPPQAPPQAPEARVGSRHRVDPASNHKTHTSRPPDQQNAALAARYAPPPPPADYRRLPNPDRRHAARRRKHRRRASSSAADGPEAASATRVRVELVGQLDPASLLAAPAPAPPVTPPASLLAASRDRGLQEATLASPAPAASVVEGAMRGRDGGAHGRSHMGDDGSGADISKLPVPLADARRVRMSVEYVTALEYFPPLPQIDTHRGQGHRGHGAGDKPRGEKPDRGDRRPSLGRKPARSEKLERFRDDLDSLHQRLRDSQGLPEVELLDESEMEEMMAKLAAGGLGRRRAAS